MERGQLTETSSSISTPKRSKIKPFLVTTVTLLLMAVAVCAVVATVSSANAASASSEGAAAVTDDNIDVREVKLLEESRSVVGINSVDGDADSEVYD